MVQETFIVTGLGYGDEGKGSICDFIVRKYTSNLVIRHNGGCQAAHNVLEPNGKHHTFAQLGSGTLAGARTYLSEFMVVNPLTLENEVHALKSLNPLSLLYVNENSRVTTPFHTIANRIRERARGQGRHGSCGMGVGETVEDSLNQDESLIVRIKDLTDSTAFRKKLYRIQELKREQLKSLIRDNSEHLLEEISALESPVYVESKHARITSFMCGVQVVDSSWFKVEASKAKTLVFEGAQGVLLDEKHGFHPFTTWSNTTSCNARKLLADVGFDGKVTALGITRAFHTRHGAGPFVTENSSSATLIEHDHNGWGEWQQGLRAGPLDMVALKYAIAVESLQGPLDGLVMTNVDRLRSPEVPVCSTYRSSIKPSGLFFVPQGGMGDIVTMRPLGTTDTTKQSILTRQLASMTPNYDYIERSVFPQVIAENVKVPLYATSNGATYKDKVLLKG